MPAMVDLVGTETFFKPYLNPLKSYGRKSDFQSSDLHKELKMTAMVDMMGAKINFKSISLTSKTLWAKI